MKLLIGFTFIPFTRHLIGLIIDPDMYDIGGPSSDDDYVDDYSESISAADMPKYQAAMYTAICWYFAYSIVYCFADPIMNVVLEERNQSPEKQELLLHPRFLYKMLLARLVILVFVNNTGRKLDNGSYKTSDYGTTPSNYRVRFISFAVTVWIVAAHIGLQRWCCQRRQSLRESQLQPPSPVDDERSDHSSDKADNSDDEGYSKNPINLQDEQMTNAQACHKRSQSHDPMKYPSRVVWFNNRHRGALVFVAQFATLTLIEHSAHMFPQTFMLWAGALACMTALGTELFVQWSYPETVTPFDLLPSGSFLTLCGADRNS